MINQIKTLLSHTILPHTTIDFIKEVIKEYPSFPSIEINPIEKLYTLFPLHTNRLFKTIVGTQPHLTSPTEVIIIHVDPYHYTPPYLIPDTISHTDNIDMCIIDKVLYIKDTNRLHRYLYNIAITHAIIDKGLDTLTYDYLFRFVVLSHLSIEDRLPYVLDLLLNNVKTDIDSFSTYFKLK